MDVKSGAGGIRDVEFLVQALQLVHAPDQPDLLTGNTLEALSALRRGGFLPEETTLQLEQDYLLLRRVEHHLQIYEDRQTHTLPRDPEELEALAKRIEGPGGSASRFLERMGACSERVRGAYTRYLLQGA